MAFNPNIQALLWLNFFLADVRDGLGPFLGVFLQEKGWNAGEIGLIISIGSICGIFFISPIGAFIDHVRFKKTLLVIAISLITLACCINYFFYGFVFTLIAQILCAISAALIAPLILAITLGIVGQTKYGVQIAKNEIYSHLGNVTSVIFAGIFGYFYGISAVFVLTAIMGIFAIIALVFINKNSINHTVSRGQTSKEILPISSLFKNKTLIFLAIIGFLFHLSNAYMLPLLGQEAVYNGIAYGTTYTSATILIAQFSMIFIAIFIPKIAQFKGYFFTMCLILLALPIRGTIATLYDGISAMIFIQILDGVGAGGFGILIPVIVARILNGSGHINLGMSFILMLHGIGGALSGVLGGYMVAFYSYKFAFFILTLIASFAFLIWISLGRLLIKK